MQENPTNKTPETTQLTYKFITNNIRTNFVVYSFSLFIIISAIASVVSLYILYLLNEISASPSDDLRTQLVTIGNLDDKLAALTILIFTICAVIFLCWIYRANNNARALHPEKKFEFTPGLCVLNYFIPIICLYWPYKSMKEIWLTNKTSNNNSNIIIAWWLSFLLMSISGRIINELSVDTISNIQTYLLVSSASHICGIISAVIAIIIVTKINNSQENSH